MDDNQPQGDHFTDFRLSHRVDVDTQLCQILCALYHPNCLDAKEDAGLIEYMKGLSKWKCEQLYGTAEGLKHCGKLMQGTCSKGATVVLWSVYPINGDVPGQELVLTFAQGTVVFR